MPGVVSKARNVHALYAAGCESRSAADDESVFSCFHCKLCNRPTSSIVFHNDKNVSVSKVALLLFAGIEQNASTTGTNRFSTTLQGSSSTLPLEIPGVWDALELRNPGINVRERGELHTPADDVTLLAFAAERRAAADVA